MSSRPSRNRCWTESSSGKSTSRSIAGASSVRRSTSIVNSSDGSASTAREQLLADLGDTTHRHETVLRRVVAEDVAEARRDHGLEAELLDRPHRVLARGAGAEVRAGDEDRRAGEPLVVEHELRVVAPLGEQALLEAGALDPLQPVARDDLVGVDVAAVERHGGALHDAYGFHQSRVLRGGEVAGDRGGGGDGGGDEVRAAAAALAALEVAVRRRRAPFARRELVGVHGEAHRAARIAPVEAGGGEDRRADLRPRPAASPPTTRARRACARRDATCGPRTTSAAARRSSMRLFVHEPMNTVSTRDVADRRAGGEAHVLERPLGGRRARRGSANESGVGHAIVDRRRPGRGSCPTRRGDGSRRRRARPPCRTSRRRR